MNEETDEFFYQLSIADIQEVANQELDRELTPEELKLVQDRAGDYISWYDAIALAIDELVVRNKDKQKSPR